MRLWRDTEPEKWKYWAPFLVKIRWPIRAKTMRFVGAAEYPFAKVLRPLRIVLNEMRLPNDFSVECLDVYFSHMAQAAGARLRCCELGLIGNQLRFIAKWVHSCGEFWKCLVSRILCLCVCFCSDSTCSFVIHIPPKNSYFMYISVGAIHHSSYVHCFAGHIHIYICYCIFNY